MDIAIFPLPGPCGDSFHGCDTTSVGVGIGINAIGDDNDDSDDNGLCCTPELVDANKCDTPGRLILASSNSSSMYPDTNLRTLDIPSRGTLEAAIFDHPLIRIPKSGLYVVLIANCHGELGRTLHVTGGIDWIPQYQDQHPGDTDTTTDSTNDQDLQNEEEKNPMWPFLILGFVGLAIARYSWRQYQSPQQQYDDAYNRNDRELHQLVLGGREQEEDENLQDFDSPTTSTRRTHNERKKRVAVFANTNRRASYRPETTLSTNL